MQSVFAEMKDIEKGSNSQQDVRRVAQLEALKRFIETMESDALEQKRIAQEQRVINVKRDNYNRQRNAAKQLKTKENAEFLKKQIKDYLELS